MADDGVQVKIEADGGPAKSDMQITATAIQQSLEGIKTALQSFGTKNKEVVTQAVQNNATLSRSFIELKDSATGGFNVITGVIARFRGVLGTLAAAISGGFLFTKSVQEMLKFEDSVRGLEIVFGVTAEKATQMSVALRLAGISSDAFEGMAFKVGRTLKTNSEEFTRLGVVIKDANGKLLPMDQLLQSVYRRMLDFKAGTDQNLFALTAVGRSAKDFSSEMERLNSVTDRAAIVQARLGIEMGPDRIAAIERYRVDINEFKIVLETLGEKIGEEVLPKLQGMAQWFNEYGPAAVKVIVDVVKGFISVMQMLGTSIAVMAIKATGAFQEMVVSAKVVGSVLKAQVTGDWADVVTAVSTANDKIREINKTTAEEVTRAWAESIAKIENLWKEAGTAEYWGGEAKRGMKPPVTGKGNEDFTFKPPKGAGAGGDDRLAEMKDNLDKMREAEGLFHEMSKAAEADYWVQMLATVGTAGKQNIALRREISKIIFADQQATAKQGLADYLSQTQREIDAARDNQAKQMELAQQRTAVVAATVGKEVPLYQQMLDKELKLRQEWAKKEDEIIKIHTSSMEEHFTHEVELNKMAADQQVALGLETNAQRLAQEEAFESQMFAAKMAELQKEKALRADDIVFQANIDKQILALEDAHQIAMTKLANQGVLDREQYALEANKKIESSFSTLFSDLASGTKTIKQSFLDFFKSISDGLSKIAADQVAKQLFGAGTSGGSFLSGITSKIFGGGGVGAVAGAGGEAAHTAAVTADTAATTADTTVKTAQVTIATTLTASFTALVAAAGAASAALSAVAASGAAQGLGGGATSGLGGLLGMFTGIPGLAVGTAYVPQDSLAVVHKGEKIIPAKYNTPGGGSYSSMTHNHFHISGPIDSRTMSQIEHAAAKGQRKSSMRIG